MQAGRPLRVERRRLEPRLLMRWHRRLQRLVAEVQRQRARVAAGDDPAWVVGDHCGHCPALLTCPAISRALGDSPGAVYAQTSAVIAQAKKRRELAQATAIAGPVPLPDGRQLVRRERWRRVYDPVQVRALLTEYYGQATADALARESFTAGALDTWAAQQIHLGGNKRERRANLDQWLMERGALTLARQYVFRSENVPIHERDRDRDRDHDHDHDHDKEAVA